MQETTSIAKEIVAFALAARTAQETLSTQSDPMVIKQFRFLIKYQNATTFSGSSDIGFTYWRVSVKAHLAYEEKSTSNFELECIIVPVVTLNSANSDDQSVGSA